MHALADRRRAAILAAAERLFRHYGRGKTTVAEIAQTARVGVGTVYLEFPSKDAIFAALSERRYAGLLDAIRRAWEAEAPTHAERLRRALDARFEGFMEAAGEGAHGPDLWLCPCPPIQAVHARYVETEARLFAEMLERGAEAGELDAGPDPLASARSLLRCYATFAPPHVGRNRDDGTRSALEGVHRLVLDGLRRRPP